MNACVLQKTSNCYHPYLLHFWRPPAVASTVIVALPPAESCVTSCRMLLLVRLLSCAGASAVAVLNTGAAACMVVDWRLSRHTVVSLVYTVVAMVYTAP